MKRRRESRQEEESTSTSAKQDKQDRFEPRKLKTEQANRSARKGKERHGKVRRKKQITNGTQQEKTRNGVKFYKCRVLLIESGFFLFFGFWWFLLMVVC